MKFGRMFMHASHQAQIVHALISASATPHNDFVVAGADFTAPTAPQLVEMPGTDPAPPSPFPMAMPGLDQTPAPSLPMAMPGLESAPLAPFPMPMPGVGDVSLPPPPPFPMPMPGLIPDAPPVLTIPIGNEPVNTISVNVVPGMPGTNFLLTGTAGPDVFQFIGQNFTADIHNFGDNDVIDLSQVTIRNSDLTLRAVNEHDIYMLTPHEVLVGGALIADIKVDHDNPTLHFLL